MIDGPRYLIHGTASEDNTQKNKVVFALLPRVDWHDLMNVACCVDHTSRQSTSPQQSG